MTLEPISLEMSFQQAVCDLQEEPKHQWSGDQRAYAAASDGRPVVKVAVGNVSLDYDLWSGLRNPAVSGLYPAGLQEIWEFFAHQRRHRLDASGRPTIFQVPQTFDYAREHYSRAVLISVMLPFSPDIMEAYVNSVLDEQAASSHLFSRMYEETTEILDQATSRVAMELTRADKVVVPMTNENVDKLSHQAIPVTHQDSAHGPCKDGNFPQKSLAVLLGLGQFGVSRIVFRDEVAEQGVQRFVGPVRSVIVFDTSPLVTDGSGGIIFPTEGWREFLFSLYDFTRTGSDLNQHRFCSYFPMDDSGCGECIQHCPSGAQAASVPLPTGGYSDQVASQAHRFYDSKLQFDFSRCCEDRGQMTILFPEWSCARCVAMCQVRGRRRAASVLSFKDEAIRLTSL